MANPSCGELAGCALPDEVDTPRQSSGSVKLLEESSLLVPLWHAKK